MPSAACMIRVARPPGRGRTARASTLHWAFDAVHHAAAPDADQELSASGYPVVGGAGGAVG
jgi:hypothetical protein